MQTDQLQQYLLSVMTLCCKNSYFSFQQLTTTVNIFSRTFKSRCDFCRNLYTITVTPVCVLIRWPWCWWTRVRPGNTWVMPLNRIQTAAVSGVQLQKWTSPLGVHCLCPRVSWRQAATSKTTPSLSKCVCVCCSPVLCLFVCVRQLA